MKTYTIELWFEGKTYKQAVIEFIVEAENESEAIARIKQFLLDKGLLPDERTKITYYANIVNVKDNCIGR